MSRHFQKDPEPPRPHAPSLRLPTFLAPSRPSGWRFISCRASPGSSGSCLNALALSEAGPGREGLWQLELAKACQGSGSCGQVLRRGPGQEAGRLFSELRQSNPDAGARDRGRAPLIKESLQCPPAPHPLGFWEIPAGGVVLLIPEKLPLGAQYPRGRVLGQGWK